MYYYSDYVMKTNKKIKPVEHFLIDIINLIMVFIIIIMTNDNVVLESFTYPLAIIVLCVNMARSIKYYYNYGTLVGPMPIMFNILSNIINILAMLVGLTKVYSNLTAKGI